MSTYPTWICLECGDKYGNGMPDGHVCTVHNGTCGICGKDAQVTEPRDFRHLRHGWEEMVHQDHFPDDTKMMEGEA